MPNITTNEINQKNINKTIANTTSPTKWQINADYLGDANADNVEIQQAVNECVVNGGGNLIFAPGIYDIQLPILIDGQSNQEVPTIGIKGQGVNVTNFDGAVNQNIFNLRAAAKVNMEDFTILVKGTGDGINSSKAATVTGLIDPGLRGFYLSSFKNIYVRGENTHTGWGMNLGSPFRSSFENIEMLFVGNGARFHSEDDLFNPGDCTWHRSFIEINGNAGIAYSIESNTVNGYMNQLEFEMIEGIDSTQGGGTFLSLTGIPTNVSGSTNNNFRGMNAEEFAIILDMQKGTSNSFEFNFVTADNNGTIFNFGADANMNRVVRAGQVFVDPGDTITVLNDQNTWADSRNSISNVFIATNAGSTSNAIIAGTTKIENIGGYNNGTVSPIILPGTGW